LIKEEFRNEQNYNRQKQRTNCHKSKLKDKEESQVNQIEGESPKPLLFLQKNSKNKLNFGFSAISIRLQKTF
jgi:hypothetical protein